MERGRRFIMNKKNEARRITSDRIENGLLSPQAYPEMTKSVRLVQTHISFVFITDRYAYKIKKPVNFGFLDFSTLSKRKYYCEQEVMLNRRLSRGVYLGVVPIILSGGKLLVGRKKEECKTPAGIIIDYAVKMKLLPMERLMSTLLRKGGLTPQMVTTVGGKSRGFMQRHIQT